MGDGDTMNASQERITHQIIENQLRGGILSSGGNRVLDEGNYTAQTLADTTTVVTLSGSPALRGFANEGFVEVYGFIRWENLQLDTTYFLYAKVTADTYLDPSSVIPIASETEILNQDHLFLATVDTTDATISTPPTVDSSPEGKATAFNLFQLLNNNVDPFGTALTQSILTVLQQLTVRLGKNKTALFQQLNPDATLPVISIENSGETPELKSSGDLRLADIRIPAGFALSDEANDAYLGTAISIIGALNEILSTVQQHIDDNEDPHGETLIQTRLVLREFLSLPKLLIVPSNLSPPSPPGSPPSPPSVTCEIESTGELRFCDIRSHLSLSKPKKNKFTKTPIPTYAYESTAYVSAFSQKTTFLEDEVNLSIILSDYQNRLKLIKQFFTNKDIFFNRGFLVNNQIDYIYLLRGQELANNPIELQIDTVFYNELVTIYKVRK
jgi:hypothetical protein